MSAAAGERDGVSAGLRRFAWITALATWLLVLVGSLVTTTGSGDAVPDWWFLPISYGSLLPPMVGGIFYEHGHRLVATGVGILTLVLAIWMHVRAPASLRRLGWIALAAVVAQGTLGGIRVLVFHGAPAAASIVHGMLAQAFFALMVAIAVLASPPRSRPHPAAGGDDPAAGGEGAAAAAAGTVPAGAVAVPPGALRRATAAAAAAVFVQIVLGTILRHTLHRAVLWIHAGAVVVVLHLVARAAFLALVDRTRAGLRGPARTVVGCLGVQVLLGLLAFALALGGIERSIQAPWGTLVVLTGHVGMGALLLGSTVALAIRARQAEASAGVKPSVSASDVTAGEARKSSASLSGAAPERSFTVPA